MFYNISIHSSYVPKVVIHIYEFEDVYIVNENMVWFVGGNS